MSESIFSTHYAAAQYKYRERSNNLLNRTIDKIAEISINIENMSKNLSDIDKRLDKLESR